MQLETRLDEIADQKARDYELESRRVNQQGVPPIDVYELDMEQGGSVELYDLGLVTGTVDVVATDEDSEVIYNVEGFDYVAEDLFSEALDSVNEGLRVLVDVEKTLYDNHQPFIDYSNDFLRQNQKTFTEEDSFQASDVEAWGFEGVYEDFADIQGWEENQQERFMEGYGEWPGFHEAIDMIWTGELDYEIPLMEEGLEKELKRLEGLDNVDEVVIGTSRGNFFSDYDVESAVEERLEEDLGIHGGRVLFLQVKSGTADVYIDDNPEMELRPEESQLAIRAEYNDHLDEENLVDSFFEAVERLSGKAAR